MFRLGDFSERRQLKGGSVIMAKAGENPRDIFEIEANTLPTPTTPTTPTKSTAPPSSIRL